MTENENTIQGLQDKISDLTRQIDELKTIQSTHGHSGSDGSQFQFTDKIDVKQGQPLKTGRMAMMDVFDPKYPQTINGAIAVGTDEVVSDGSDNAQVTLQHQPNTDGTTNQTFYLGFRGPIFVNVPDGTFTSGTSILTTNRFSFGVNALAGATLVVRQSGTEVIEGFNIVSNTQDSITISGTFGFTASANSSFDVFVPIYFGSAEYPWRRLYTGPGSDGGIRFGYGSTNGGQNGLLYMDSAGDLYWRNKSGTSTKLN